MQRKIRFADLFCGMGGIRIGFENALASHGIEGECVFSSDTKKAAVQAYTRYFRRKPTGDITKVDASLLPDFDFFLAGFPCQAFSQAVSRRGFQDTRGTLFFDVARILSAKRPAGFLLENVEGLVNHRPARHGRFAVDIPCHTVVQCAT